MRARLPLLPLTAALLVAASGGCHGTLPSLFLEVADPEALAPTQLRVTVTLEGFDTTVVTRPGQPGAPLPPGQTIRLLLPDAVIGSTARLDVEALRDGSVIGHAEGRVRVSSGEELSTSVTLVAGDRACTAQSCPDGCCREGQCLTPSFEACGTQGSACSACDAERADGCDEGGCRCGADPSCGTGQRCTDGTCVANTDRADCASAEDCVFPPGPCHEPSGTCSAAGTCSYTLRGEGSECDDANACTTGDACNAGGQCIGAPKVCDAPPGQCHQPVGTCEPDGSCRHEPRPEGEPCDDGSVCSGNDACDGNGVCSGNLFFICATPPDPQCQSAHGSCHPKLGCTYANKPNGSWCNTGQCSADTCQNGFCQTGPSTCGPGQICCGPPGGPMACVNTSEPQQNLCLSLVEP